MRKLTASVKGGPCSSPKVVVLEAFLLEGLLIDPITPHHLSGLNCLCAGWSELDATLQMMACSKDS
jgi:hypothetical protein